MDKIPKDFRSKEDTYYAALKSYHFDKTVTVWRTIMWLKEIADIGQSPLFCRYGNLSASQEGNLSPWVSPTTGLRLQQAT